MEAKHKFFINLSNEVTYNLNYKTYSHFPLVKANILCCF